MRSLDPTPLLVSRRETEELDWLSTAMLRHKGGPGAPQSDRARRLWSQRHSVTEWRMARTKNTGSSIFSSSLSPPGHRLKVPLPFGCRLIEPDLPSDGTSPQSWHPREMRPAVSNTWTYINQGEWRSTSRWHSLHYNFFIFFIETRTVIWRVHKTAILLADS
jgi:hypothetical protein